MVDVAKERHYRSTRHLQRWILFAGIETGQEVLLQIFRRFEIKLHAKLGGQQFHRVAVER